MPDPNTEHGLRVQLATALREVEELRDAANTWLAERDALRADVQRLREALKTLRTSVVDCAGLPQAMDKADAALCTGVDRG